MILHEVYVQKTLEKSQVARKGQHFEKEVLKEDIPLVGKQGN